MANKSNQKKKNTTTNTNIKPVEEKEEKIIEEKKKDDKKGLRNDTTSLSIIDTQELNSLIEEDLGVEESKKKDRSPIFYTLFLIFVLVVSLILFGITLFNKNIPLIKLISSVILTLFTILFVSKEFSKSKKIVVFSGLLLLSYFIIEICSSFTPVEKRVMGLEDFSGKKITYVMEWASRNKVTLKQDYEYSDMVEEYQIISQSVKTGTDIKKIDTLTVTISEGPNPYKEVMVPSMVTWNSERVIKFINDNYLSNVIVEFVESDKEKDTVIEQNTSGNLKRNDELKLTFSYGEEFDEEEIKLIDFTKKSKFEVEFYMKQHQLRYEFDDDFSPKIKHGLAIKQDIEAGEIVHPNDEKIKVTFSKGPEIKIPNLKDYDMTKITEWAIKNRVKLKFSDRYDDSIKEGKIISTNYNEGDIVEQGTVIEVVLSRGPLKMIKFNSLNEFYDWANKYNIHYEEQHEFNDKVPAGEVISYSYKAGDAIKNDDTIIVKISDGIKKTVPKLIGLSRSEAIKKLDNAGLKYNFIYRNSSEDKDIVIRQSMSAGSEVSSGTTITVTLSNGKREEQNNNNNNNNSNNDNGNNNNNNEDNNTEEPVVECKPCTIGGLRSVYTNPDNQNSFDKMAQALRDKITSQCPGIKVNILGDTTSTLAPGEPVSGFSGGSTDSCQTITITIAK